MSLAARLTRTPTPHDPALGAEVLARLPDQPGEIAELIRGTAGCSPYLKHLIEAEATWLSEALDADPDAAFAAILADAHSAEAPELPAALRRAKRRAALWIALCDLGGAWPLERVTGALTELADLATERALDACVRAEAARGKLPGLARDAGAADAGVFVLAMGKMGAAELNYSSDIDLIVLFDGARHGAEVQEVRAGLVRATRKMAAMLSDITGDGYVFRTDLRLRPDASVTPVCLSMEAAETYYESVGRTWERAAYVKARVCAGDKDAGQGFLQRLTPFVWRRHLDFAAIQDAHDMRLAIRAHKGLHGDIRLEGHDMKLGPGGIREIEFFTQTRQIIAGGRDPSLRVRTTVGGLDALANADWIPADTAAALTAAYRAHREVEHRVQMIHDAQTHKLPGDAEGFARLAAFMGRDAEGLRAELTARLAEVHRLTEGFFAPRQAAATPAAAQALPEGAVEIVEGWRSYPALRSPRAVEIFERLKPDLLARLSRADKPDEALRHFDGFLKGLPAGVQVFSLFDANPQLVDLISDIAATAPALSAYLGRNAGVFDAVIGGTFFDAWPGLAALRDDLRAHLAEQEDYERKLDAARRWLKEWHFRVGVHHLRGLIDAGQAGAEYADLAEAVLAELYPAVVDDFSTRHGLPPGRGAAVLGMGSLGARELSATSDLDLIVIYDAPGDAMSEGRRPLAARQYYARLTQHFLTALTAQTAEGAAYEVDMRLRPSGRQGPVATSLEAFRGYQQNEAWTWEHLALTRARPVAGSADLGDEIDAFRTELIAAPRDEAALRADVAEMRERLARAKPPQTPWEAKRGPGRMQDIDLLAQAAALAHGCPARVASAQLQSGAGWLTEAEITRLLTIRERLWTVQAAARLLTGRALDAEGLGEGGRAYLARQTGADNADTLAAQLAENAAEVTKIVEDALSRTIATA